MTEDQFATAAIRTPDQRLRVFVSSTLAELAEERAAVARAVNALRLTPVMFELGARPHPPQQLYRAYLAQSDIFVGLYWQRYGWVGPGMDVSGLEDEYNLSGSLPRLLYVKTPAPDREPRLTALIERLQTEATDSYRSFRTPRELGRLIRDDLALLLSERFVTAIPTAEAAAAGTNAAAAVGPSAPTPTGTAASTRRLRRSVPAATTSLVGRDEDITQVLTLLKTPEVRLVTLTGPGGIGRPRSGAPGRRRAGRSPSQPRSMPSAASTATPGSARSPGPRSRPSPSTRGGSTRPGASYRTPSTWTPVASWVPTC